MNLDKFINEVVGNSDVLISEDEKTGVTKHFRFDTQTERYELVKIVDDFGEHELTSIPNFSAYKADIERGMIYSLVSDKWLSKGKPNYYGYCYSTLRNDDGVATPISLHSVIMSAALQQEPQEWIDEGLEIDHKNGVKHQNNILNLRLVTRQGQYTDEVRERMSRNAGTPLTKEQVQYIRYFTAIVKAKGKKVNSKLIHLLADKYDKRYTTIKNVVDNVTYSEIDLNETMKREVRKIELEHDLAKLSEIA